MKNFQFDVLVILSFAFISTSVFAEPIKKLRMAVPGKNNVAAWPVYQKDSSGLYDQIFKKIYEKKGYQIRKSIYPLRRCEAMVLSGKEDVYAAGVKSDKFSSTKYALWETAGVYVLFSKKTIKSWEGVESLKGKLLIGLENSGHLSKLAGLGLDKELKKALRFDSSERALKMLIAGRVDAFVSSLELIEISGRKIKGYKASQFRRVKIGNAKFYPLFQKNKKGKLLAKVFDEGIMVLSRSGELERLFKASSIATLSNIDANIKLERGR